MGGPWRAQGFDPSAWRPPAPRIEARGESVETSVSHDYTGIVIGYVASVVTSLVLTVAFLKYAW